MKRIYGVTAFLMISALMFVGYGVANAATATSAAYLFRYLQVQPQHPIQYPIAINYAVLSQLRSGSNFILQPYPDSPPLPVIVQSTSVFNGIHRFTGDISAAELQHIGSFSITVSADGRETIGNININNNDYGFSTHNGRGTMNVIDSYRQPVERCYTVPGQGLVCS